MRGMSSEKRYRRVQVSFSDAELAQLRAEAKAEGRTLAGLIWARALKIESSTRPRSLFLDLASGTDVSDSDSTS